MTTASARSTDTDGTLHAMTHDNRLEEDERRRRGIRRTTFVLAVVAIGIYVAFIVSSILKAHH